MGRPAKRGESRAGQCAPLPPYASRARERCLECDLGSGLLACFPSTESRPRRPPLRSMVRGPRGPCRLACALAADVAHSARPPPTASTPARACSVRRQIAAVDGGAEVRASAMRPLTIKGVDRGAAGLPLVGGVRARTLVHMAQQGLLLGRTTANEIVRMDVAMLGTTMAATAEGRRRPVALLESSAALPSLLPATSCCGRSVSCAPLARYVA